MQTLHPTHPVRVRLEKIFSPDHALCRDDVVWLLEYIKKKVADQDPKLKDLSQPRLLANFHAFAEVALLLIHKHPTRDQEVDRLRDWLAEAAFGLDIHTLVRPEHKSGTA